MGDDELGDPVAVKVTAEYVEICRAWTYPAKDLCLKAVETLAVLLNDESAIGWRVELTETDPQVGIQSDAGSRNAVRQLGFFWRVEDFEKYGTGSAGAWFIAFPGAQGGCRFSSAGRARFMASFDAHRKEQEYHNAENGMCSSTAIRYPRHLSNHPAASFRSSPFLFPVHPASGTV